MVGGDQRAAGASPAPRPDNTRLLNGFEPLDAVEWLDHPSLRCRPGSIERRQRENTARAVRLHVHDPPSRSAHTDALSRTNRAAGIG
jgi:hypothetical protein